MSKAKKKTTNPFFVVRNNKLHVLLPSCFSENKGSKILAASLMLSLELRRELCNGGNLCVRLGCRPGPRCGRTGLVRSSKGCATTAAVLGLPVLPTVLPAEPAQGLSQRPKHLGLRPEASVLSCWLPTPVAELN